MKLSAPVYQLKRQARLLSREENIPLHVALDRIAFQQGFSSWSLLAAKASAVGHAGKLYSRLSPGDMVLLGARPGHGKTLLSLELAVEAMKAGHKGAFFTLEYTERDVRDGFHSLGVDMSSFEGRFEFDGSDAMSADYIVGKLDMAPRGSLVVIDYLQLLDQRRENPPLPDQVSVLKEFAKDRGLIMVFISQIDRSYDPSRKPCPDLRDIRLPNPLDLTLFSKTCFLNSGKVQFS